MKKREIKNLAKAFNTLALVMDEEQKKLYDTIKGLKLCQKRQERLLRRTLDYLDSLGFIEVDNGDYSSLYESIERELNYPLYRVKGRKNG